MISVYLRGAPAMAKAVIDWQHSIREAVQATGQTPEYCMRVAPANDARAVANAVFMAQVVTPSPLDQGPAVDPETLHLVAVELERLERDAMVYRQRLEEEMMKRARDREQAACDISRLIEQRDTAMRLAIELREETDPYAEVPTRVDNMLALFAERLGIEQDGGEGT